MLKLVKQLFSPFPLSVRYCAVEYFELHVKSKLICPPKRILIHFALLGVKLLTDSLKWEDNQKFDGFVT